MANSLVKTKKKFSVAIQEDKYKALINNTLGNPKKAERFIAAISSAVAINPTLQECDANSIITAALLGETLNLSPSPQLGQYYLVPYDTKNGNLDVKQAGKKLAVDKDYSAVYSDNINVGVAKVAVAGLGDYSIFGATVKFNIVGKNEENQIKPDDTKNTENKADTSSQPNSNLPENKQPTAQTEKSENITSNSQSIKNNDENVSSHNASTEVTNEEKTHTSKSQLPSSAEENGENVSENDLPIYDKSEDKAEVINDGEINNDLENKKDQNTEDEKPNTSNTNEKDGLFTRVLKVIIGFFKSIIKTVKSLFDK